MILPSTWIKEPKSNPSSYLEVGDGTHDNVAYSVILIELDVTNAGTFSALIASDFSETFPLMALFEKAKYSREPMLEEKSYVLDDFE